MMWNEDKIDRARRGHERRQGQSTMPLIVKVIDMTTIRVTDTESGGWTEWDISAWRVRRINEFDPAA